MAQQHIFSGTVANDGTGTPGQNWSEICEANFTDLYNQLAALGATAYLSAPLNVAGPTPDWNPGAITSVPFPSGVGILDVVVTVGAGAAIDGLLAPGAYQQMFIRCSPLSSGPLTFNLTPSSSLAVNQFAGFGATKTLYPGALILVPYPYGTINRWCVG